MRLMESQPTISPPPPVSERVTICWIVAATLVAICGYPWVAIVMCLVGVGGPAAALVLATKIGLDDRG